MDSKKKMDAAVLESIGLLKEVVNNDTSKDMISFLREEMDKSREHELKLIQMLNSGGSATQQQQQQQHAFQYQCLILGIHNILKMDRLQTTVKTGMEVEHLPITC